MMGTDTTFESSDFLPHVHSLEEASQETRAVQHVFQ